MRRYLFVEEVESFVEIPPICPSVACNDRNDNKGFLLPEICKNTLQKDFL
jgi:hypothetical protein